MTSMAYPISAGSPHLPRLLSGAEREAALDRLSVEFTALSRSKRAFLQAAWILRRQGVLVVRQAVPPQPLRAINAEVNQLLEQLDTGQTKQLESNAILNLPNKRRIKGYENFMDVEQAVINHRVKRPDGRSGSDAGMVDIFHPERLSDAMARAVTACLHERLISRLLLAASLMPMRVKCRNLYLNRGVKDTRGYHCDGRSRKFKSFVFLTDVRDLGDGPYCYVPATHRDRLSWKRNRQFNEAQGLNRHEYSQLQGLDALPLLAYAGDMVISSQRGAHRGHPQHPNARRAVLVNMYQR